MKIYFDKSDMLDALKAISGGVTKQVGQRLGGFKLAADDEKITLSAVSEVLSVDFTLNTVETTVTEPGEVVVDYRLFANIIKKFSGDNVDMTTDDSFVISLRCGSSKMKIQGKSADAYPQTSAAKDTNTMTIDGDRLKGILSRCIPFSAVSMAKRPILNGVLFNVKRQVLENVASNGNKAAFVRTFLNEGDSEYSFVIPIDSAREILKILNSDDNATTIIAGNTSATFRFGSCVVTTRILEGKYIDYGSFMFNGGDIIANVDRKAFKDAIERTQLIISAATSGIENLPAIFQSKSCTTTLSCKTPRGESEERIHVPMTADIRIGFNVAYMMDVFSVCKSDKVRMEMSAPSKPIYIHDGGDESDSMYLIMPVRLHA